MMTGCHCEVWQIDEVLGNKRLATVFVLNEHMPLELIYRISVSPKGVFIRGRHSGWQWDDQKVEVLMIDFLLKVQQTKEEIYLDICDPEPDLPGYPYVDYHPKDYPVVIGFEDLTDEEKERLGIEDISIND